MNTNVFARIVVVGLGFTLGALISCMPKTPGRLVLAQGRVLNVYLSGKYQEVQKAEIFYGYGWLDSNRLFVAYQKADTSEAVAELKVIDFGGGTTTKLGELGGVGETVFNVDESSDRIVFNDGDGLKLLIINPKTNTYSIKKVKECGTCYAPFWVDAKTIGFMSLESGKPQFKSTPAPVLKSR